MADAGEIVLKVLLQGDMDISELASDAITISQFSVLLDIIAERGRQDMVWGEQNHRLERWLAILAEELGEVAKETLYLATMPLNDEEFQLAAQRYRTEVIQIAAVAVAMLESFDRNYVRGAE